MKKHLAFGFLVATCFQYGSQRASAQSDLSVGYELLRLSVADGVSNLPVGVGVNYAYPLSENWQVVAAFDWAQKKENGVVDAFAISTSVRQWTAGAGVRRHLPTGTAITPYVHILSGIARSSVRGSSNGADVIQASSTDLMLQPGIGITAGLTSRLGAFAQIDYRRVWPNETSDVFFNESVRGIGFFCGVRIRLR